MLQRNGAQCHPFVTISVSSHLSFDTATGQQMHHGFAVLHVNSAHFPFSAAHGHATAAAQTLHHQPLPLPPGATSQMAAPCKCTTTMSPALDRCCGSQSQTSDWKTTVILWPSPSTCHCQTCDKDYPPLPLFWLLCAGGIAVLAVALKCQLRHEGRRLIACGCEMWS